MKNRKIGSIKNELIQKAKEAMLLAVQIFNNPNVVFKSESFIVISNIAWTYLLHAYYRSKKVDYRYYEKKNTRKIFDKTKHGAHKHWELERCLNEQKCPLTDSVKENLKFLIGLRHEIEHQMTTRIDDLLSARFQSSCLNFNDYLKQLFPEEKGIEKHLSFSLQFSSLSEEQMDQLFDYKDLPNHISNYIQDFDKNLSYEIFNSSQFAYRVMFIRKTANHIGQADKVIEFVSADSEIAKNMNKDYAFIKEKEKKKYLPNGVVSEMNKLGYLKFGMHQHTQLWQQNDAKNSNKNFGVEVAKTWYWYQNWLDFVTEHCKKSNNYK
jgi:hypothetical protein